MRMALGVMVQTPDPLALQRGVCQCVFLGSPCLQAFVLRSWPELERPLTQSSHPRGTKTSDFGFQVVATI